MWEKEQHGNDDKCALISLFIGSKYLVHIRLHLDRVRMDRKWVFPEKTSEDPNAGSPWSALNEIELDVHSSRRSKPESIHYFVTDFF